jgi:uncharacterized protein (DUF4415 family)
MKRKENSIEKSALDPHDPQPLTPEQQVELEALDALSDDDIDYSDAPHTPDAQWKRVGLTLPVAPAKKLITLRIDEDIIDFFRNTGHLYQTRINRVLRAYMQHHKS